MKGLARSPTEGRGRRRLRAGPGRDVELCRFEGVTVVFGGLRALNGLEFAVNSDDGVTGIIGPNGAGKSTALAVMMGAVKPAHGRVHVLGHEIKRAMGPEQACGLGIAKTYQTPRVFPRLTVRQNLLAAAYARRSGAKQARMVDGLLDRLSLGALAGHGASDLPLAERKRVELGKALATGARLILLDEMFEGLGQLEVNHMVEFLKGIHAEGTYLIFVEHVLHALRALATRLIVLDHGTRLASGPTEAVFTDPVVRQAYLGFGDIVA